jgi:hypothetical protein
MTLIITRETSKERSFVDQMDRTGHLTLSSSNETAERLASKSTLNTDNNLSPIEGIPFNLWHFLIIEWYQIFH